VLPTSKYPAAQGVQLIWSGSIALPGGHVEQLPAPDSAEKVKGGHVVQLVALVNEKVPGEHKAQEPLLPK
jgi:hypothetical protein